MQSIEDQKEILKLASQALDETIQSEDFIRLNELLSASSINRQYYLEIVRLESLLYWEQEATEEKIISEEPKIIPFPFLSHALSIAAVFVALIVGWWAFSSLGTSSGTGLATGVIHKELVNSESNRAPNGVMYRDMIASAELQKSKFSSFGQSHSPKQNLKDQFHKGIELLQHEGTSSEFGPVDRVGPIRRLSRIEQLSRPTERGVLPAVGNDMIALSEMQVDVDSQSAELIEMIQILDVRDIATNIATGEVQLNAEAMVNQSYGACQQGADFAVSFHAFRGLELTEEDEIGSWESSLKCDIDPQTWESLISSVQLPTDTEFVVVSINVRKSGKDAFVANTSRYYSDDFRLSLHDGERVLISSF